jgi:hypothetical protein
MDEDPSLREKFRSWIAVPVGLLLLVPLVLAFVVWFYVAAFVEGIRGLLGAPFRRSDGVADSSPLQTPHFTDARSGISTKE